MACSLENFFYHEWLCKTNFSFLTGASHPDELLKMALEFGYSSVCVSDFDGVYGIARAYNELKHLKESQKTTLKLNYAAEIHLTQDHDAPILEQKTISLHPVSWTGYRHLCQILSYAHRDSKDQAYISVKDLLQQNLVDLFAVIPMRGGFQYFWNHPKDLEKLQQAFSGNVYLAVTKTFSKRHDHWIHRVYELSRKYSLKKIISQDAFMATPYEKSFHDVLISIKQNKTVTSCLEYFFPNGERSFHSKKEIFNTYKGFSDFDQMLTTMQELNESCQFSLAQLKYHYPREMIPAGYTAQAYLEKLSWEGAKKIYGSVLPVRITEVLSKELDLIEDLDFADYFLTVWDIVSWAKEQNILCQGRGSAANSAVCYVLGVTACDPTLFDLLIERFISKERGDPPDIDVDFEHERREEVLQYIYRRYGRNRAAMLANVITFKAKGAVRAVGKVFGVDDKVLSLASKTISTVVFRSEDLSKSLDHVKEINTVAVEVNWELWKKFSKRLRGFPRHLGLHSGGFLISQYPINELVPQEPATMENRTVIQWAKDDIEELGLFKIDCLALGMLSAIRKCFDYVKECYGKEYTLYDIPQDDLPTYNMIQRAETVGVFQIESRAQMSMLPRLKPKCFYDLVVEIAIIRPGPIQGKVIHPYLRRRNGLEPINYPDESVKPILAKTMGVIIFQEQLMRVAIALGDFTGGEANELRKQIGAWNSKLFNRNLHPYVEKLLRNLTRKGIDPSFINQIVEQMKGFAQYGFPESHSISFAYIAYASCYLKCHYPAAFFVSVLNSQPMGFYSPHALLQAARRDKVKVLPLSVNDSEWEFKLEALPGKEGRPPVFAIRLGMSLISGLSKKAVQEVVEKRQQNGKFLDFDNFATRVKIFRDDYSALAAANAFHCLGLERFEAIWKAEAMPFKPLLDIEERKLKWQQKNSFERSQMDFIAFGTSLETHPVKVIRENYWRYSTSISLVKKSLELSELPDRKIVFAFGMLLVKQAPPSAKGMVFVTLEDETGFINLAFAPQVYRKYFKLIETSGFLLVQGKLQKANSYHSILVNKVLYETKGKLKSLHSNQTELTTPQENLKYKPRSYI